MRVLVIGDVVGRPGRRAVALALPGLRKRYAVDLCVVNGENAAGGRGINQRCSEELFRAGADFITLGNHAFDQKEVYQLIQNETRLIRPLNLPPGNPGQGCGVYEHSEGSFVVAHLCGRVFMPPFDCPFRAVDELIDKYQATEIHN